MKKVRKSGKVRPAPPLAIQTPRLIADANREILVEGCRGIIAYDEETVHFRGNKMDVKIRGKGLILNLLNKENLLISGEIFHIEYLNLKGD